MNLRQIRKNKGYSQKEIAKKLNIPLRTYQRYEDKPETNEDFKIKLIKEKIGNLKNNSKQHEQKKRYIGIIGAGNVGYPLGFCLAKYNKVIFLDSNKEKIKKINSDEPIFNGFNLSLLENKLRASDKLSSLDFVDMVIMCLPTLIKDHSESFDTSIIENYLEYLNEKKKGIAVILKSTLPIGFTRKMHRKFRDIELIFSPEFLREEHSLEDTMYPSRLIFGINRKNLINREASYILENITLNCCKTIFMSYDEAESVKLFSNAYLALRVAYINEIDSFALKNHLKAENIIKGFTEDERIGKVYSNPSFGFGGNCLPKDIRQLNASLKSNPITSAAIESNKNREALITKVILNKAVNYSKKINPVIGFYNVERGNSILKEIMDCISKKGFKVILYKDCNDFNDFVNKVDYVVANRVNAELSSLNGKLFTRDLENY